MKKTFCFLFLTSLLLASCTRPQEITETFSESVILDPASVPTLLQTEEIPIDSCKDFFTENLTAFLSEHKNIQIDSLIVECDDLSLASGRNGKPFKNWVFKIDLLLDTSTVSDPKDFSDDFTQQIKFFLEQYNYYNFRAKELEVNVFNLEHQIIYNLGCYYESLDKNLFRAQPGDEYAVQTLAFNYSKPTFLSLGSDYSLKKFGVLPETDELFVEYHVAEGAFDYQNMESSMKNLEQVSMEIRDYLLSSNVTETFISDHSIQTLTISFYIAILGENTAYHFDV